MMNVLLTGAFNYSEHQIEEIEKLGYDVTYIQEERQEIEFDVSLFEVVVCNALFLYNSIDKFTNLKMIQLTSAGLDRVPIDYIQKHNITLLNAKGIYSIPIAEWVLLKILEIYKKSKVFIEQQEKKEWIKHRDLRELTNKNVSIIGFGSIGQEIAKRLLPFNVRIFSVDIKKQHNELFHEFVNINDFDQKIHEMDILILTLSLTKDTKYYIDKNKLSKLKENAMVINVSRGQIINENDLVKVLTRRNDIIAVLDVFEQEPLPNNSALWSLPNITITPHNAFASEANSERLYYKIYRSLSEYSKSEL